MAWRSTLRPHPKKYLDKQDPLASYNRERRHQSGKQGPRVVGAVTQGKWQPARRRERAGESQAAARSCTGLGAPRETRLQLERA